MFVEELQDASEWEDFVKVNPGGTFYHTLGWKDVIEKSFSLTALYLIIKNEDRKLVGICPTFILARSNLRILSSLPHSDFGGPLIEKKYVGEASLALRKYIEELSHKRGISFAEICFLKDGNAKSFKSSVCFVYDVGVVDLNLNARPSTFIWEKILSGSMRKKIRHLWRDGFQVRKASTAADLRAFLTLYYKSMKYIGAIGKPPAFFMNAWNLLHPGNFDILLVEKKSNAVGGEAFFKYGDTIYLAYTGIDRDSVTSKYSVQPFLYMSLVRWAEEHGFRHVCFGSTTAHPRSPNEITNYSQKMMFGGSFLPQEMIFVPFTSYACAVLLFGSKAIKTWVNARKGMPRKLQNTIEAPLRKLVGIF